eukprot:SAG31_NODE_7283_length_1733_cov_1.399633_2_plen_296_part_00
MPKVHPIKATVRRQIVRHLWRKIADVVGAVVSLATCVAPPARPAELFDLADTHGRSAQPRLWWHHDWLERWGCRGIVLAKELDRQHRLRRWDKSQLPRNIVRHTSMHSRWQINIVHGGVQCLGEVRLDAAVCQRRCNPMWRRECTSVDCELVLVLWQRIEVETQCELLATTDAGNALCGWRVAKPCLRPVDAREVLCLEQDSLSQRPLRSDIREYSPHSVLVIQVYNSAWGSKTATERVPSTLRYVLDFDVSGAACSRSALPSEISSTTLCTVVGGKRSGERFLHSRNPTVPALS